MMLATLVTGWLLYWTDDDWKLPFYLNGICSFIWGLIFQFTTTGEPSTYPYLKPKEKEILDAYSASYNAKKVEFPRRPVPK
jgi:sugar phosphate permease